MINALPEGQTGKYQLDVVIFSTTPYNMAGSFPLSKLMLQKQRH
jgi:hypothetical protein